MSNARVRRMLRRGEVKHTFVLCASLPLWFVAVKGVTERGHGEAC